MRSGPVSTQTAPGLNCRSQLPLSLPHCFKLVLGFFFSSFNNPSNQTGWVEIALPLSSFLAVSPSQGSRPDAGKWGGGGLLAVKSTPILGKPWVTPAVVLMVWRIGGGKGPVDGAACVKGIMFKLLNGIIKHKWSSDYNRSSEHTNTKWLSTCTCSCGTMFNCAGK